MRTPHRRYGNKRWLLNDGFLVDMAAGTLDGTPATPGPGLRAVVDTENKLSIVNGRFVCMGGKAVPAYDDPALPYVDNSGIPLSWVRQSGLCAEWEMILNSAVATVRGAFGLMLPTDMNKRYIFIPNANIGGILALSGGDSTTRDSIVRFQNGQSLRFRVILTTAGGLMYVSTDGGYVWSLIWDELSIVDTPYEFRYRNRDLPFSSSYVRVYMLMPPSQPITSFSAANTPVMGSELVTGTLTIGTWYSITATETNHFYIGSAVNDTFRATATTALDANNKVRALTLSSLATYQATSRRDGIFHANIVSANNQGGVCQVDSNVNPQNGWYCYYNQNDGNIYLDVLQSGAWFNLFATSGGGYGVGDPLRVVRRGNDFGIYYRATLPKIGSTTTLPSFPQLNYVGAFRPNAGDTISGVQYLAGWGEMGAAPPGSVNVTVVSSKVVASGTGTDWVGRGATKVLADGTVVLCYVEGPTHEVVGGVLHIRFSADYGVTWSDEDKTIVGDAVVGFPAFPPDSGPGFDEGPSEPWLTIAPNGDLLLHCWKAYYHHTNYGTWQSRSTDNGATWGAFSQIAFLGITGDDYIYATDQTVVIGSVIYMVARRYADYDLTPDKMILVSSPDNGATWTYISDIIPNGYGAIEAGIEWLGGNNMIALARDWNARATWLTRSTDLGITWSTPIDISASVNIAARVRVYTRNHLQGLANWQNDPVLIATGFVLPVGGANNPRINTTWVSLDQGVNWQGPFYIDDLTIDAGYGDVFYNPSANQYVIVTYQGNTSVAVLKQYNLSIDGI